MKFFAVGLVLYFSLVSIGFAEHEYHEVTTMRILEVQPWGSPVDTYHIQVQFADSTDPKEIDSGASITADEMQSLLKAFHVAKPSALVGKTFASSLNQVNMAFDRFKHGADANDSQEIVRKLEEINSELATHVGPRRSSARTNSSRATKNIPHEQTSNSSGISDSQLNAK